MTVLDGETVRELLGWLRDALLGLATRGSVVFAMALLGTRLARSLGPERRHTVWLAAILLLALLPVFRVSVPPIRLPVMNSAAAASDGAGTVPEPPPASPELVRPARRAVPARWIPLAIAAAWAAGVLAVAARPLAGRLALGRLVRSRESRSGPAALLDTLSREMGVRGVIALSHPRVTVPFTFGTRRPAILLPPRWTAWNRETLRAVLVHELAHQRRRDGLSAAVARAVCALLWFNPLVWLARSFLKREAELSCDRSVLAHGISRSGYAAALMEIGREGQGAPALLAASALAGRGLLRQRIALVLFPGPKPLPSATRRARLVAIALCALSPLLLLPVSLQRQDPLHGTWSGQSTSKSFYEHRLTLNEDGSGQKSLETLPEMPASFCRYLVDRRWKDPQGSTWYQVRIRWSGVPLLVYALIRVEPSGTRFEMADSPTGYPAGFLGPPGSEKHLVYVRR